MHIQDSSTYTNNSRYNLRNDCSQNLVVPRSYNTLNDRVLAICRPKLWNSIPGELKLITDIELFKGKLKHIVMIESIYWLVPKPPVLFVMHYFNDQVYSPTVN